MFKKAYWKMKVLIIEAVVVFVLAGESDLKVLSPDQFKLFERTHAESHSKQSW